MKIANNIYGMKVRELVIAICCLASATVQAQDLHFSQYYETPLFRNPAFAGLFEGDVRAQMVYRNQWASVTTPYQTASLNGEYKFPVGQGNDFVTAGLQVLMDRAGTVALTTTHLLPVVNYHKSLSDEKNSYVSLGFMGGMVGRRLDRSKVTTNNQYDGFGYNGSLPDGETFANNYAYFDAGVGLSYNASIGNNRDDNYYVGLAYHHFNKPSSAFYNSIQHFPKWVASAGLRTSMGEMAYITLSADASLQGTVSGRVHQVIGGAMYSRKLDDITNPNYILHFGAFLRWNDAIIPVVKLDYNPFSIGLSYDMNISQLRTASQGRGGFEFSLTYRGFLNSRSSTKDIPRCPRF